MIICSICVKYIYNATLQGQNNTLSISHLELLFSEKGAISKEDSVVGTNNSLKSNKRLDLFLTGVTEDSQCTFPRE